MTTRHHAQQVTVTIYDSDLDADVTYVASSNVLGFLAEARAQGLEVKHYHGRGFVEGPAVIVDHPSDFPYPSAIWDSMGMRAVGYVNAQTTKVAYREDD